MKSAYLYICFPIIKFVYARTGDGKVLRKIRWAWRAVYEHARETIDDDDGEVRQMFTTGKKAVYFYLYVIKKEVITVCRKKRRPKGRIPCCCPVYC